MPGVTPDKRSSRSRQRKKPYQPAIGFDFGKVEEVEAKSRGYLIRAIVLLSATAIIATGGYALTTGNHTPLITVWAIAGPFIGALVAYYFGLQRNDTG
jgi:hypothetical protein